MLEPSYIIAAIDRVVHHSVILDMMSVESYRAEVAGQHHLSEEIDSALLMPFTKKLCRFLPKGLPLNGCHVDPSLLGSRPSACRVARQVLLTCGIRNKAGLES